MDKIPSFHIDSAHVKSAEDVFKELGTSHEGLTHGEAEVRLELHGPNELKEGKRITVLGRIWEQLKNPMLIVLLAAGIISGALGGHLLDMIIILSVVAINVAMGVIQEGKAERALEALKAMSSPTAKVRRSGSRHVIPASEVVPGDIVELEAGDYVCADMRLVEAASLKIEEAALTGESVPVEKSAGLLDNADAVIGDRVNMAYYGTAVVYGRGVGVVTSTGMNTEMGKIAASIAGAEETRTPIQRKLSELSKVLSFIILGICILIFALTLIKEGTSELLDTFLLSVSLAVAAIPEGLAAVVTIVMAMGVQRMASKNAIIRKLPAVETLGSTQVICTDKTGTLTQNRMTVMQTYTDGEFRSSDSPLGSATSELLVEALAFCNDAVESSDENGKPVFLGDPTETALLAFASKKGYNLRSRLAAAPRVLEFPFDSARKLMSTFHSHGGKYIHYVKGAPDVLLGRCSRIILNNEIVALSDELRGQIEEANNKMASNALRVLAAAMNIHDELPATADEAENDLVFLGLAGMIDPARPEVKAAVDVCTRAGMRPIMITGDHKTTAVAIAKELGILKEGQLAITGAELDKISDDEFISTVDRYSVYARVAPEHKVRIVDAWQKRGKICSMTGDGVNDAPALKKADIGVGMGITGTDVTKNVADMVLTDDNFATIIVAVEEGRKIYSNIRKCIQYLLSANLSEVLSIFVATLLGHHLLHTIHILWINLVTDTFPALALGVEKAEKDVMDHPPRDSKEGIFAGGLGISVAYQGVILSLLTLAAFFIGLSSSKEAASTMAFCTLTFAQMLHSLNVRSLDKSIFTIGLLSNRLIIYASAISIILTFAIVQIPGVNGVFRLTALNGLQWFQVFLLSSAIVPAVELIKYVMKRVSKGK